MKRNVSVVCVCSAPNCLRHGAAVRQPASQPVIKEMPGSVASGTPYSLLMSLIRKSNLLPSECGRSGPKRSEFKIVNLRFNWNIISVENYDLYYLISYLLTYLFTYLLTPWSRVLLEKLTGFQLVKKFPTFYGTLRFITAFTSARHLSLS